MLNDASCHLIGLGEKKPKQKRLIVLTPLFDSRPSKLLQLKPPIRGSDQVQNAVVWSDSDLVAKTEHLQHLDVANAV